METSELRGTKPYAISGFFYPKVVETTVSFRDFREALYCEYPWNPADAVELRYFESTEQRFLPLICDEHLGLLFSLNADSHFEVDAEPDEEVPRPDDEDEILFPELVDRVSQHAVEDEYAEEPRSRARFDDTDDEERQENIDSFVLQEYDGEDMPTIEWNKENPNLTPGTVFESMVDCRNAVTTYCIVTENSYEVDRSEPRRFTIHCPYDR
ncbi:hypothetical protein D1007_47979 [Hordeum vulgare]|nr:hypothetical protein D1007_47979 [Hordeum vulgare]